MKFIYRNLLTSVLLLAFYLPLSAEYIFLKDGSIHKGNIISDSAGSVTIIDAAKKRRAFKRSEVIRILYTELTMGKMLVQKKNGESFTAYMVDEDRDSYTFRNELYKNVEFKVPRLDVLFLAERNPSGLKGEADTDRIELSWYHPYDKMEKYNIYTKNSKKDKYTLRETSRRNSYTLEDLPSNTRFFIVVTGIDSKGDETPYSNEIEVTTKNIKPDEPSEIVYSISSAGVRSLSWKPSVDPDGRVERYRIYGIDGADKKLLGETKNERFNVQGENSFGKLYVAAVDDKGDESELSRAQMAGRFKLVSFYPGVIFPMGKLADIAGGGFGGAFSYSFNNYYMNGLSMGIDAGFYYLTGKDSYDKIRKETAYSLLAPLMLTAGYRFEITETVSVKPYLTAGIGLIYSDYTSIDQISDEYKDETLFDAGPAAGAGVEFLWRYGYSSYISIRGSGVYLAGSDEGIFVEAGIGFVYRL